MQTKSRASIPEHIAVIMDGNGRWAQGRGLPRLAGHKQGAETVERVVRAAAEKGVKYLTLFAFSTENWKRPQEEVDGLMGLMRTYLRSKIAELHKHNVRLKIIGDTSVLSKDLLEQIQSAHDITQDNTGITVTIAFNYSGRWDIAQAAKKLAQQVAAGTLSADAINEDVYAAALSTAELPDPDLMIRTSGEHRISNFLLWQCAYTEFFFTDTHWPDFSDKTLDEAIQAYQFRDRRFGALNELAS